MLVTELLIVIPTTLITSHEWFLNVLSGILLLDVLQGGIHGSGNLVKLHAAGSGVHGGLETQPEELFIFREVPAGLGVLTFLRGSQAGPPLFSGVIDGFSTFTVQDVANERGRGFVVCKGDHYAAALA